MKPHLWVVEMMERGKWAPTCGVGFSRADGRRVLWIWRDDNPNDTFRLTRYEPSR